VIDNKTGRETNLTPSIEAVVLATDLIGRYRDMALGRARIQLYAALANKSPQQVDLLSQVCLVLMNRPGQVYIPGHYKAL
jgi:hypothetical protein